MASENGEANAAEHGAADEAALRDAEREAARQAAVLLGRRTSAKKKISSAANLVKAREKLTLTEEMRAKMREAQRARRERERQEQELANEQRRHAFGGEPPHDA
jgi:hypothetical protein